jgi:ASC-1-like (ASCH) protein
MKKETFAILPKKRVLRFNKINYPTFENIKKSIKKVETRAYTVKYFSIKAGDTLVLVCDKERIEKRVKKVTHFKTLKALFNKYKIKDVMPEISSFKEAEAVYYQYPGYKEKIKKFGILAFEI